MLRATTYTHQFCRHTAVSVVAKGKRTLTQQILLVIALLALTSSCATNPVTGKNEISLFSERWELSVGQQQYQPGRQSQGGDYVVDPMVQAYVQEIGDKIAAVSDRPLPYEFAVINNSTPNAWALPGGKIAINRGLLTELNSESELAAVLSHEIIHAAAKHGAQGMQRGLALQAAVLATTVATTDAEYGKVAALGTGLGAQLINSSYGRNAERESDLYGMNYMSRAGYDPKGAVVLQETFVALSGNRDSSFIQGLFASHPPSQQRVDANRAHLQQLPAGGIVGRERYQQMTRRLQQSKPAYAAYDNARTALTDQRPDEARALLEEAMTIEQEEAQFYALLGDIETHENRLWSAARAFDKATALNPNYFYPHLRRGLLSHKRREYALAEVHLRRSVELLETAQAYNALGDIANRDGREQEAEEYYAKAATDSGPSGQAAASSLVKLRVSNNPGAYISFETGSSSDGELLLGLSNTAPRDFRSVGYEISFVDVRGRSQSSSGSLAYIAANSKQFVNTALRIAPSQVVSLRVTGLSLDE